MKSICVDFDGCISVNGGTVDGAEEGLVKLINSGYKVYILTANNIDYVRGWMSDNIKHAKYLIGNQKIIITNTKPVAIAYIDNRAYKFTSWDDVEENFI